MAEAVVEEEDPELFVDAVGEEWCHEADDVFGGFDGFDVALRQASAAAKFECGEDVEGFCLADAPEVVKEVVESEFGEAGDVSADVVEERFGKFDDVAAFCSGAEHDGEEFVVFEGFGAFGFQAFAGLVLVVPGVERCVILHKIK